MEGGVEETEVRQTDFNRKPPKVDKMALTHGLRQICSKDLAHLDPPVMFPSQPRSGAITKGPVAAATSLIDAAVDLHEDLVGGYEKWHQEAEAERPCSSQVASQMEWI